MKQLILKLLYSILSLLNDNGEEKLLKSHLLNGVQIKSESGWSPAAYIHETKPFYVYKLKTVAGLILDCADEHLIYTPTGTTVWAKDLKPGDYIMTEWGSDKVVSVTKTNINVNMCDVTVLNENESYYSNHILSHNTTTSAIYMLHYILFNVDKNSLVLGNKRKTAVEILSKLKSIYFELPYFLKPGIYKWNEAEIVLDNGCRCMAEATTINSGISFTFHCVLADEFAHVPKNIIDPFYNNLFPTITAGKAKFIITSTQNGYNLFYRLYKAAEAGDNDYKPFKTDWYEVPEWNPETRTWDVRDEEWHRKQVANYGSEEAFNKQFGTNFDVSAKTLIAQKTLNKKKREVEEFKIKDLPGIPYSEYYKWKPGFEPYTDLRQNYIITTCDLAEGGGNDYTVFNFYKMINPGSNDLECIGRFRSNKLLREQCSLSLQLLCSNICNINKLLLSFEYNTYGELFYNQLMNNMEKNQQIMERFDPSVLVKYYNESGTKFTYGIKITAGNKTTHCLLFKESYERNMVLDTSTEFMAELSNFCDDGTGHYKASFGHDDMVMSSIQLEFVKKTLQYKIMRGEFDEQLISNESSNTIYNPFESQVDILNRIYGSSNNDNIFEDQLSETDLNKSRLNRFM